MALAQIRSPSGGFSARPPQLITDCVLTPPASIRSQIVRPKGCRLDQRAVHLVRLRREGLTDKQPGEPRVLQDASVAVIPIQRE